MEFDRYICSGADGSDVKCSYTSGPDHSVDCSEFISRIYTDIAVSYLHMN